jgi:class 3 adenylate cyclase
LRAWSTRFAAAVEVPRGMIDREPGVAEERRIRFRIGINLGDRDR